MSKLERAAFFTFINPETMKVPCAFEKLMATKGSGAKGAIPDDTSELKFRLHGLEYVNIMFPF